MKAIAKINLLYRGKIYKAGEEVEVAVGEKLNPDYFILPAQVEEDNFVEQSLPPLATKKK